MLVRLPDGTLRQIEHLKGAKVGQNGAEGDAPALAAASMAGRYAVVMVVAEPN